MFEMAVHVLDTTHPAGLMPMGSFPSSQEPPCVLCPIQGPGWGKESCGGGRPQADLSSNRTGRDKGHMGALTEVPSPESLDEEELISKSAGPVEGL